MRFATRLLVVFLFAAIGIGVWSIYSVAAKALQAERTLHATLFSIRLVDQFVSEQNRWPRSWGELESLAMPSDEKYKWPADGNLIKECVDIDFAADPAKIINQQPMEFTAIKPIGPCYPYRDYGEVPSLQKTIRRAIK
jgi:hypothetical protein